MTVRELCEQLNCTVLVGDDDSLENKVADCYIGDLLSWVMGRAKEQDAWITVMGNVNGIAVAKLADISCVLLCEDAHLDDEAKAQAEANHIPVLSSGEPAYELAIRLSKLLS